MFNFPSALVLTRRPYIPLYISPLHLYLGALQEFPTFTTQILRITTDLKWMAKFSESLSNIISIELLMHGFLLYVRCSVKLMRCLPHEVSSDNVKIVFLIPWPWNFRSTTLFRMLVLFCNPQVLLQIHSLYYNAEVVLKY